MAGPLTTGPTLSPVLPAEAVPTSIAVVGHSIYVGELKGFPFRPGTVL